MTAPKPAITDREPDGWQNVYGHPVTRGGKHWPDDAPFWKVTEADLAARDEAVRREVLAEVLPLLRDLTDPDPCWFDHHGGCQAHGFLEPEPGERCPHQVAKELLAEATPHPDKETP